MGGEGARGAAGVARNPDPERLGGLAWTRRTNGRLTGAEKRRLLAAVAAGQAENLAGRIKLALGRVPPGARHIDVTTFIAPDSALAREAEAACAEQPPAVVGHSYRTWMYGLALATLDGNDLDRELFYCAALVHDYGIVPVVAGEDFTLRSGDKAIDCASRAGRPAEDGELMADAICVHPTPGITPARDGALGCYVQWGATLDGVGLRRWDVTRENVDAILAAHPRGPGFKDEFAALIRAEAAAVPGGRFALLARSGFALAVRLAPFKDD